MKMLKKAVALLLAVAFIFTLAACHPKDEIAISSGDYEITSAMYSYYLVMADSEAKGIVDESGVDTKAKGFKYTDQKVEDKPYTEYVKDKALENCLRHIALAKLCKEAKVELDKDTADGWKSTANYYWNYAYGGVFSQNGIAYSTYEKILLNEALYNEYFDYLYTGDGEKAMAEADIKSNLNDHYSAVYLISHDYSEVEKPDLDKIKEGLEKYKEMFEKGKTYDEVKAAYDADQKAESDENTSSGSTSSNSSNTSSNSSNTSSTTSSESSKTDSSADSTSTTTSSEDKEEEEKPIDEDITILTDNDGASSGLATVFTKYADVAKLKDGEVAIIADSDNKVVHIVVKKDINADKYYLDNLSDEVVYMVNGEGFDKFLAEQAKALDYTVNNYAVNRFKVNKIKDGSEA